MHLPREEFERLVEEAIGDLPAEFAEKLDNVEFLVEDQPTPDDYRARGVPPGQLLLGVYRGVPLTQRSVFASALMPDRIVIYQRPIEQLCYTRRQIVRQVRRTVLHEIAHHFGIDERRVRELGY